MKNILLSVVGLSPQVITETLFALHQNHQEVHAIHVITTREGKDRIFAELLGGGGGQYYKYLEEYGPDASEIDFGPRNVHVLSDDHGVELSDIVDQGENERLLKKCLEMAFSYTRSEDTAVFFSVAGGRKTMSSCLTLAAQIYGRPQDRLYHVLVSPEFESNRDFYYPPKVSRPIELRDAQGQPFYKETRFARVNLVHVPFFSVRDRLAPEMLKAPSDPATLMLSLIREEERTLTINLKERKVVYKTVEADLPPIHLALYAFFVFRKKNCDREVETCGHCTECFMEIQDVLDKREEFLTFHRKIAGHRPAEVRRESSLRDLDAENFRSYKSKIKNEFLNRFGPYVLPDLEISSEGKAPNTRYGIRMDRGRIEVVW